MPGTFAQVLKAYCLVKLGGEAEALELCDDVMVRVSRAATDVLHFP